MEDIERNASDIADKVDDEANRAAEQAQEAAHDVKDQAAAAADEVAGQADQVADQAKDTFESAKDKAKGTFDSATDKVERTVDRAAYKMGKLSDNTAPPDMILAGLDLATLVFCLFNIIFFFVASGKPYYFAWFVITLLLMGKSAYAVFLISGKDVSAIPNKLPNCIDGAYFFCGFILVFLRPYCLFLLVLAITINTLVDIGNVQSSGVVELVKKFRPDMVEKAKSMMEHLKLGSKVERVAAALEMVNLFLIPFARSGFLLFPTYIVFLALRYRTSNYTRMNFQYVDDNLTKLLKNKSVPPPAIEHYEKAKTQVSSIVMK